MVINLRRYRRLSADETGRIWHVGHYRKDMTGMKRRAFLNDRDVTNRTFYVDTRRGIIRMFLHNAEGRAYIDPVTGEPAWEERRGHVRVSKARP
jgi:hypothetical protein